jgi:hypothetical protein
MDLTTLYAIEHNGMMRPGYVLDRGKAPGKVTVRRWWRWDNDDEDWLNATPNLAETGGHSDVLNVTTAAIKRPWAEYCAHRKQVNAEAIAARQESEAQAQRRLDDTIKRIEGVRSLLDANAGQYIDANELVHLTRSGRIHDTRFSAKHVLELIEAISAKFDMTVHVEREGQ